MQWKGILVLALSLLSLGIGTAAARVSVGPSAEYFVDSTGEVTLTEIMSPQFDHLFRRHTDDAFQFGLTQDIHWIRFRLGDFAGQLTLDDSVLYFDYSNIDSINVFFPLPQAEPTHGQLVGGWLNRYTGKDGDFVFPVFAVPQRVVPEDYVYVRVRSDYTSNFRLLLENRESFAALQIRVTSYLWFASGVFAAVLLTSALLFLRLRDHRYGYGSLYILSLLLYQNGIVGTFYLLSEGFAYFVSATVIIWSFVTMLSFLRLSYVFLEIPRYVPGLRWAFRLLIVVIAAGIILAVTGNRYAANWVAYPLGAVIPPFLVISAILTLRRGHGYSQFFLLAAVVSFSSLTVFVLRGFGVIPHTFVTSYSLSLGGAAEALLIALALADQIRNLQDQRTQLFAITLRDELTGLFNRRFLNELADQPNVCPSAIAFLDIDRFKKINDAYGHDVGDTVLHRLGVTLKQSIRSSDYAVRVGGEEFAAILPNCDLTQADNIAESIRQTFAAEQFSLDIESFSATVSIGVVEVARGENTMAALRRADQAMYRAKQLGRNRVYCGAMD